jgi:hypothetical protein
VETEIHGARMFSGIELLNLNMTAESMVDEKDRYWQ